MAFYVPLGSRGLIFRFGTLLIGVWGGLVYRNAYRRRSRPMADPHLASLFPDIFEAD